VIRIGWASTALHFPGVGALAAIVALLASVGNAEHARAADYDVHIKVDSESGVAVGVTRDWYDLLTESGAARLRIGSDSSDPPPSMRVVESGARPSIEVQAILSARGVLFVPERTFQLGDRGKVKAWLAGLRDGSGLAKNKTAGPFGLTAAQTTQLSGDLARPVTFSTADLTADAALARLAREVTIPLVDTANVSRETLTARDQLGVGELHGLALGTAIACVLRASGRAFTPEVDAAGKLRLRVMPLAHKPGTDDVDSDVVVWPVGWKPKQAKLKTLPKLFDFFEAEVDDYPLTDTLAALSKRLDAPMLYDRWAIERAGVAFDELRVSQTQQRIAYSLLLHKLLGQVDLKYELRVDDAEQPFLWITPR
jgi:hypothetical protein